MTVTDASTEPVVERKLSFANAIGEALDIAMSLDPGVFLLGEDIEDPGGGSFGANKGLTVKYGRERVRNTPISEQAIIGAATGAALAGMRPVPEIMLMNFMAVCMDQLVNHAAKLRYMSGGQTNVPITVRTAAGGGFGFGGQHSDMLEAWLCHVPGLKVVVPSTAADAKGLLLSCIFDDDPCVFVEMIFHYFSPVAAGHVPGGDVRVPLGQARIARPGSDATVITYGRQVHDSVAAAEVLAADHGVEVEVVDLRTLVPLDLDTMLRSAARTKRAVVVHEAVRRGGFGAEVAATVAEELFGELEAPVRRVASRNTPMPYAPELEAATTPSTSDIAAAVRDVLGLGRGA